MAITILKREGKQKYLILIFGLLMIVTVFVVWQGLSKNQKIAAPAPQSGISDVPKIEINFKILEHPFLKETLPFEPISPFEESELPDQKIGRNNPFVPY